MDPQLKVCPIKGCNLLFTKGILGWHKHASRVDAHPYWHPDVADPEKRKDLFREEFPSFFGSTPPPPATVPPPAAPGKLLRDLPHKELIRFGVDVLVELEMRLVGKV